MDGNQLSGGSIPSCVTGGENSSLELQQEQQQEQQQNSFATNNNNDAANKRTALAGQWRTPPLPIFPSMAGMIPFGHAKGNGLIQPQTTTTTMVPVAVPSSVVTTKPAGLDVSQLPDSTEDYAKALQEAYQRGAEAAQAMAAQAQQQQQQQQQQTQATIMSSTACPDFGLIPGDPAADANSTSQPQKQHLVHPGASAAANTATNSIAPSVPNPLSMPPPPPVVSVSHPPVVGGTAHLGMLPLTLTTTTNTAAGPMMVGPTANSSQDQQQQQQPTLHSLQSLPGQLLAPGPFTGGNLRIQPAAGQLTAIIPPTAQRSMSLPDMSTYAAQQEEEKRQKRLARNRASARLRRLRKKNLVEAYEQEVGILEKTLAQLQAHEWGETDNVAALTEALSMDRGQQVLTFEQRHEVATGLLDQQLQWIEMLEEIMLEDYVLHNVRNGEFSELKDILGLDEEQLDRIEMSKAGWEDEWTALQTLKASVVAMRENDWLWNESVSSIAEQFMAILHKNQVSKFLLWADHNAEAIDELDGVNASPGPAHGPVFAFGVESQPGEGFGEDDK